MGMTAPEQKPPSHRWLTQGVLSIGLASLFSDIGHETATAVLPLFLVTIGGSPFALGIIEGLADFAASGAKLWGGYVGGRLGRRKTVAASAYFVTAVSTSAFGLATTWLHVLFARAIGWFGRGFRGPLRDALLAEQTTNTAFGRAFGFERAMDTLGAILGSVLALGLLALATPLRTILFVTLFPGLLAGLLFLRVYERPGVRSVETFRQMAVALPPSFRRFLLAVGFFGAGDFSRTLLILWALGVSTQITRSGQMTLPVLLYVAYNVVGAASAYISGAWSDRIGRRPLLILGYMLAAPVSLLMALDHRPLSILLAVFLGSGVFIGIEEALEKATAADLLPEGNRAFGFGALATVNALGDLLSSALVGFLWQTNGAPVAFGTAAAFSLVGSLLLAATPLPGRPRRRPFTEASSR